MIIVAGYLNGIKTLMDGSVKIDLTTQEITPQLAGELFAARGKFLKVALSDNNIIPEAEELIDKTEVEAPKKKGKTKGQVLRSVLYILWKQQGEQGESEAFYEAKMDHIIQHFKDKLE